MPPPGARKRPASPAATLPPPSVARILLRSKRASLPAPSRSPAHPAKPLAHPPLPTPAQPRILRTPRRPHQAPPAAASSAGNRRDGSARASLPPSVADLLRAQSGASKRIRSLAVPPSSSSSASLVRDSPSVRDSCAGTPAANPAPPPSQPAYIRFKHLLETPQKPSLAQKDPEPSPVAPSIPSSHSDALTASPFLSLPPALDTLVRIFDALENIIGFLDSRNQPCIYVKARSAVEAHAGRSFSLAQLAQIIHLYPEAYTLKSVRTVYAGDCVSSVSIATAPSQDHEPLCERRVLEALADPSAASRISLSPASTSIRHSLPPASHSSRPSSLPPQQQPRIDALLPIQSVTPRTPSTPSVVHSGTFSLKPIKAVDDPNSLRLLVQAASALASRHQIFRARVEAWVSNAHAIFLREHGIDIFDYIANSGQNTPNNDNSDPLGYSSTYSSPNLSVACRKRASLCAKLPRGWHPDFDLASVPEVPQAPLPKPELSHLDRMKLQAGFRLPGIDSPPAASVLGGSLKERIDAKLRERRAVMAAMKTGSGADSASATTVPDVTAASSSSAEMQVSESSTTAPVAAPAAPETPAKPKSRAAAILERVREKQRLRAEASALATATRNNGGLADSDTLRRISMLRRMPAIAKSLCLFCLSLGRMSLTLSSAASHTAESLHHRSVRDGGGGYVSHHDAEVLLRALAETVPSFCQILESASLAGGTIRVAPCIKLHTTTSEVVRETVDRLVAELERPSVDVASAPPAISMINT